MNWGVGFAIVAVCCLIIGFSVGTLVSRSPVSRAQDQTRRAIETAEDALKAVEKWREASNLWESAALKWKSVAEGKQAFDTEPFDKEELERNAIDAHNKRMVEHPRDSDVSGNMVVEIPGVDATIFRPVDETVTMLAEDATLTFGTGALTTVWDWQSMANAPRDGTVIEIENNYGVMPWYGIFKWSDKMTVSYNDQGDQKIGELAPGQTVSVTVGSEGGNKTEEYTVEPRWVQVNNPAASLDKDDEAHFRWRPYHGDPANYTDPTGGAQETQGYWLRGIGR